MKIGSSGMILMPATIKRDRSKLISKAFSPPCICYFSAESYIDPKGQLAHVCLKHRGFFPLRRHRSAFSGKGQGLAYIKGKSHI